jgi:hypothetical protein
MISALQRDVAHHLRAAFQLKRSHSSIPLLNHLRQPKVWLKVAIRLPEELQSANRLTFDFSDGSFVVTSD